MELYDSYQPHLYKEGDPIAPPKTKWIWDVFWILSIITIVEVGLAFLNLAFNFIDEQILKAIYILLTIGKGYYIVFSYMHLKDEKRTFKLSLGVMTIILVYFVILMMIEGFYQENIRLIFPGFMSGVGSEGNVPVH